MVQLIYALSNEVTKRLSFDQPEKFSKTRDFFKFLK